MFLFLHFDALTDGCPLILSGLFIIYLFCWMAINCEICELWKHTHPIYIFIFIVIQCKYFRPPHFNFYLICSWSPIKSLEINKTSRKIVFLFNIMGICSSPQLSFDIKSMNYFLSMAIKKRSIRLDLHISLDNS